MQTTNNGTSGGLLYGETDKDDGKGIIAETPNGHVILGGGESIINEQATKENCQELSRINQSTGGNPIPCDIKGNTTKKTFTTGGKIGSQYSINDTTATINYYLINALVEKSYHSNRDIATTLNKVINVWDGYKYYTELRKLKVIFSYTFSIDNSLMFFSAKTNDIFINTKKLYYEYKRTVSQFNRRSGLLDSGITTDKYDGNGGVLRQSIHAKLFHEVQHAIQRIEGTKITPSTPEFILSELRKIYPAPTLSDSEFKLWLENREGRPYKIMEYEYYITIPSERQALEVESKIWESYGHPANIKIPIGLTNENGGYNYSGENMQRAKKADLLTLPKNVSGTNCGNCSFVENGFCLHKEVLLQVTERMCCAFWNNDKALRSWEI